MTVEERLQSIARTSVYPFVEVEAVYQTMLAFQMGEEKSLALLEELGPEILFHAMALVKLVGNQTERKAHAERLANLVVQPPDVM